MSCSTGGPGTTSRSAWGEPVTCLTVNSAEVISALTSVHEAGEMDHGDVFEVDVARRPGIELRVELPGER